MKKVFITNCSERFLSSVISPFNRMDKLGSYDKVFGFNKLSIDEFNELIMGYDILISAGSYTSNNADAMVNTKQQLANIFARIGRSGITNKTFLDINDDYLLNALNYVCNNTNLFKTDILNVIRCVQNNNILILDYGGNYHRIVFGLDELNAFITIPFDFVSFENGSI